jgi:hypothetical protein
VNGLVVNSGTFTNSAVMGGTGTVETGAIVNTSTMFGYSGNPPGLILSGYTWSGASSNLWTNSSNWYGGLVPVSTGDAVIYTTANQPELDQPSYVCRQLYIHAGGELTITADGQLTAYGRTRIGQPNGISIESSATSTGSFIDNGNISYSGGGSVQAKQYLVPDQWHGYCLPFTTASTNPFIDYYMKWFDETGTHYYKYVIDPGQTDSSWTKPGLGFLMWSSSATTNTTPVSPSGLLNTGAVAIPVTRTWNTAGFTSPPWPSALPAGYDGFNMVGNPYPSAIDLNDAAVTWTNVDQKAWFYNPISGNWEDWLKAGGGTRTSSIAPVQQGFFVHCNDATPVPPAQGSGSIGFTNAVRLHSSETFLKESVADMLTLKVVNAANGYSDLAVVRFSADATAGLDPQLDGEKFTGQAEAPQLYFPIPDSWPLSVNTLPWAGPNMTIPLCFTMLPETNNLIEVTGIGTFNQGTQLILEDKKLDIFHNLVTDPEYQFASSPEDDPARFVLHFTKSTIGIEEPLAGFRIYAYDGEVYVKNPEGGTAGGTVRIYDLTGRIVFSASLSDQPVNRFAPGTAEGYYIVRVVGVDFAVTGKVYLR